MRRQALSERPDWRQKAEAYGFPFHSAGGTVYWDETVAWSFTLSEIEQGIEAPTADLEQLCLAFVKEAITSGPTMTKLGVPESFHWYIRNSWSRGERNLYGRLDLAYDGSGPARLLEYNADTPTSLFEASVFQWSWLEDQVAAGALPEHADQFNSLHERLVQAFSEIRKGERFMLHCAAVGDSVEDNATVAYLADCARQAGHQTTELTMSDIGVTADGEFTGLNDEPIGVLFKLYPWEWLFREEFAQHLAKCKTQFIEPPWKALLSTKALLPLLWQMAPNHPNLLEAYFADDPRAASLADRVEKPVHSREGANIRMIRAGQEVQSTPGSYGDTATVVQALAPTAMFPGGHAIIGSWLVASQPAGMGIREDKGLVTRDSARFVPHFIDG
jgi:glutathionylspermidine synthase